MSVDRLPFTAHLEELRKRLIVYFSSIAICFVICYILSDPLINLLFFPIKQALPPDSDIVFTALTEGFMAYLKVSFWAAIVISMPVLFYEIWAFISPALYDHEKQKAKTFFFWAVTLFTGGGLFGYWVVIPTVLSITLSFAGQGLTAMPRLQNYLLFVLKTILTFGLVFEIPFFMAFTSRIGLVSKYYFKRNRKYAYIVLYLLSIAIVPTDIFSQLLLFLPFMGIYEIGVRLSGWLGRKNRIIRKED